MSKYTKIKIQLAFVDLELKLLKFLGKVFRITEEDRIKAKWKSLVR